MWIPGWQSAQAAGWWSGLFFWCSIASLMMLGVFEVASHRYSERKDELTDIEQRETERRHEIEMASVQEKAAQLEKDTAIARADIARANRDTANATAEAAKANERSAELKLALEREIAARQPRSLTEGQKEMMAARLRDAPKGKVFVVAGIFDAEGKQFAEQISEFLKGCGYTVEAMPMRPNTPIGWERAGLAMVVKQLSPSPPHGRPIQEALESAGFPIPGQETKGNPEQESLLSDDEVLIGVGPHP